jgi:hypothetical protein
MLRKDALESLRHFRKSRGLSASRVEASAAARGKYISRAATNDLLTFTEKHTDR